MKGGEKDSKEKNIRFYCRKAGTDSHVFKCYTRMTKPSGVQTMKAAGRFLCPLLRLQMVLRWCGSCGRHNESESPGGQIYRESFLLLFAPFIALSGPSFSFIRFFARHPLHYAVPSRFISISPRFALSRRFDCQEFLYCAPTKRHRAGILRTRDALLCLPRPTPKLLSRALSAP